MYEAFVMYEYILKIKKSMFSDICYRYGTLFCVLQLFVFTFDQCLCEQLGVKKWRLKDYNDVLFLPTTGLLFCSRTVEYLLPSLHNSVNRLLTLMFSNVELIKLVMNEYQYDGKN